ncbi:hypothetical protein [Streptomyces phytohabitans]|uniref:hypothetical protein n=1 Tax=Streptomyces phytohabitans TaxID=1150371 RepID=UPI00345C3942
MRAPMYGGVPTKDLQVEAKDLQSFKKRVDDILTELEKSPASRGRIADQEVPRSSFGGQFAEADALYGQYNRVHTLLTTLSQTLSDQIEAMGIAVMGAKNGFDGLEDDVRRRFWQIQSRAADRYHGQQVRQDEQEREKAERLSSKQDGQPSSSGHDQDSEGFSND